MWEQRRTRDRSMGDRRASRRPPRARSSRVDRRLRSKEGRTGSPTVRPPRRPVAGPAPRPGMGRTRRSRASRVRRGHRSELFLSRSPTPPPSRISSLTLNLRSRLVGIEQQLHRRTKRRPEREPDRPNVVGRPDGRPEGVGRRMLKEHRRSFVTPGPRQPRTQRPTSVPLTSGPKVHPTATHHGRGRRPPLEPTHRRRDLPAPRGAAHRRLGDQHRPSPAHRRGVSRLTRAALAGRSSCLVRARPRAGAASTFPVRELVRRRAGRCSSR